MSIKAAGGVFGRNPTFNDVTVEGDLSIDGTLTIGGSVITGLNLQGNWNASTNTPDLTVLTPDAGKFWIVSVAGSTNLGGFTNWTVGDWALYDGSAWQRIEGGTVDLSNAVTGTLAITNGGTGASTASTARTNLGSGTVGDNLFTATTALAAQQAMDTEVGVDVQPYDATILKSADIGVTVEAYDSTILKSADIGVTVEAYDSTILKSADIGVTVQGYDSTILNSADIGVTVEAYDATILKSADIGSTVQAYDADTAKYDDTTANFTGTLQNGGSNVVVDTDIGSTVQGYDADTTKNDVANTFTQDQTFSANVGIGTTTTPLGQLDVKLATGRHLFTTYSGGVGINSGNDAGNPESLLIKGDNIRFFNPYGGYTLADLDETARFVTQTGDLNLYKGNLVIGTSGKGIDFSATAGTGTSELFDDYEEGTWTPVYEATGTAFTSVTMDPMSNTYAKYTKVGNLVTVVCYIRSDALSGGSGSVVVEGLPFTAASGGFSAGSVSLATDFTGDTPSSCWVAQSSTQIRLYYRTAANGATTALDVTDLYTTANRNVLALTATYIAA